MKYGKKLSQKEQDARITAAPKDNIDYQGKMSLEIPRFELGLEVFSD
jgi:hypothetical protein